MNTKKILSIILALLVVAALVYFVGIRETAEREEVIKIGAILPLTGDLAMYGVDTKRSIELAVEQYNLKNHDKNIKIELVVEDSMGKARSALTAANKLVTIDQVWGIIGPITSPELIAISELANRTETIIISPSATSRDISELGEYIFRTVNSDDTEAIGLSTFILGNYSSLNLGIISLEAAGTLGQANSLRKLFLDSGGKVSIMEVVPEGIRDARSYIAKILREKVDAIYISGYTRELALIVNQIREVDSEIQLFAQHTAEDKNIYEITGQNIDGMIFSATTIPDKFLGDERESFIEAFYSKYGTKPGFITSEIYDAMNVLLLAIEGSEYNRDHVLEHLSQTRDYYGASGIITFDPNGDVNKPISIAKWDEGNIKYLYLIDIVSKDIISID